MPMVIYLFIIYCSFFTVKSQINATHAIVKNAIIIKNTSAKRLKLVTCNNFKAQCHIDMPEYMEANVRFNE